MSISGEARGGERGYGGYKKEATSWLVQEEKGEQEGSPD